jgi:hypothetical protein
MKTGTFTTKKPLLKRREMVRNDQILHSKLLSMKSNLDTGAPHSFMQTYHGGKKEKNEADKNTKIFNENKILLSKLNRIASRGNSTIPGSTTAYSCNVRPNS